MSCANLYIGVTYAEAPQPPSDNPEYWPSTGGVQPVIRSLDTNVKIWVRFRNHGAGGTNKVKATLYYIDARGAQRKIDEKTGLVIGPAVGGVDDTRTTDFTWGQVGLPPGVWKLRTLLQYMDGSCGQVPEPPVHQSKLCGERFITISEA